jgi:hypothetical protein
MYDPAMRSARGASANVTFVTPRFANGDAANAPDNVLLSELSADDHPSRVDLMFTGDDIADVNNASVSSYVQGGSGPSHVNAQATDNAASSWDCSTGQLPPDDYILVKKVITRKMTDKNRTRHDALHMMAVGAAKRMVVDGKRITTQDLNYTILKRQYMYAQKPSTAQAPQGCRCLGVTGDT